MPIIPHVPFAPKSPKYQSLLRCVKHAAAEMGVSEFLAAKIMSHFLEQVAAEVAAGKTVRIIGFGMFGPKPAGRSRRRAAPFFEPACSFNCEVEATCSMAKAEKGRKARRTYYHSHHPSSSKGRSSPRVFTAQASFREQLDVQARKMGFDG